MLDFFKKKKPNKEEVEFAKAMEDYKVHLSDIIEKSNDLFEKQIIYVAAGTLFGSFYMVEKIFKDLFSTSAKYFLVLSWFFVGATIVINMMSHYAASKKHNKSYHEIINNKYDIKKIERRNKHIRWWNLSSIISYFLGITFLIIYITINIYTMTKPTPTVRPVSPSPGTRGVESNPPPPPPKPQSK